MASPNEGINLIKQELSRGIPVECRISSDSMVPLLRPGDTFLAKHIAIQKLTRGDIIVCHDNGRIIAHRFLAFQNHAALITKGDNKHTIDQPIPREALLGKVIAIRKGARTVTLESTLWDITNGLIAQAAVHETRVHGSDTARAVAKTLRALAQAINPSYRLATSSKDHTLENHLVMRLSEIHLRPDDIADINQQFNQWIDWPYLYQIILYNSIGPLVYTNLTRCDQQYVPEWFKGKLKDIYIASCEKSSRVYRDIVKLLTVFQKHAIPVIVLKGFALAAQLYPTIGMRPMEDVDMLIKKDDWPRIQDILHDAGFSNNEGLDLGELEARAGVPLNWHVDYKNTADTKLEIKSTLFTLDFPDFHNSEHYWHNAQPLTIETTPALTLSNEDSVVYLATRMINVGFRHLLWSQELREFISQHPHLNWHAIVDKAFDKKVSPAVYFTLDIVRTNFNAPVPHDVLNQLKPSGFKRFLFARIYGGSVSVFRSPASITRCPQSLITSCLLLDKLNGAGFIKTLRYALRLLFPPSHYVAYRYRMPLWQARLGVGYIRRLGKCIVHFGRIVRILLSPNKTL